MNHPRRRYAATAAIALSLALGASACGGGGGTPSGGASSPAPSDQAVATQVTYGTITGKLNQARRTRLAHAIGRLVDGWWDAAYLGGDYPRSADSFTDAFPGFTAEAAAEAAKKPGLMTNADIAGKVDSVEAIRRVVALDPLVVKGKPVGLTARVWLAFHTTGQDTGKEVVSGSLSITPEKGQWRVFAFDITKQQTRGGAQ